MITENVLKEWYTENASRRFPLATVVYEGTEVPTGLDDTGRALPNSLLVGLQLLVPRTMLATREAGSGLPYDSLANNYRIYLKTVVISATRVEILFATVSGSEIAKAVWSPETEIAGLPVHGVAIAPLPADDSNIGVNKVSGFVFLGPSLLWAMSAGTYTFTGSNIYNSMVSEECIAADDNGKLTGLYVNGEYLTGDITFVEGENTALSVSGNTVTVAFAATPSQGPTDTASFVSDMAAVYGRPITEINGVKPDANGNFTVDCPDGTMALGELDHGITIESLAGEEAVDKEDLEGLLTNIQTLNVKEGRLNSILTSIEENVNALQNELGFIKMARG